MELEKQVCSLELSKKLKELGFEQESLFVWIITISGYKKLERFIDTGKNFEDVFGKIIKIYSAYTVAELGEMLLQGNERGYRFKTYCSADNKFWIEASYTENRLLRETKMFNANTEAGARAKMLIYLKENNLI